MNVKDYNKRVKRLKFKKTEYLFNTNGDLTSILINFNELKQWYIEPLVGHLIDGLITHCNEVERDYKIRQAKEIEEGTK